MKKFNKLSERQMTRANGGGWPFWCGLAAGAAGIVGSGAIIGGTSVYVAQQNSDNK